AWSDHGAQRTNRFGGGDFCKPAADRSAAVSWRKPERAHSVLVVETRPACSLGKGSERSDCRRPQKYDENSHRIGEPKNAFAEIHDIAENLRQATESGQGGRLLVIIIRRLSA